MARDTLTVNMDNELKTRFEKMCEEFGVSAYTVISSLVAAVEKDKKIPFDVYMNDDIELTLEDGRNAFYELRRQAAENGVPDMTMEEIDEEIRKTRYGEGA